MLGDLLGLRTWFTNLRPAMQAERLPGGKMEKWESQELEQMGQGRKEGWRQEASRGKIDSERVWEREALCREEERGESFSGRPRR